MSAPARLTLSKKERLCSRRLAEQLFSGAGSHSVAAFPLRVVWTERQRNTEEPPAQLLISVPKRRLKHAVERNRVKRQVREAYRHHKQLLYEPLEHTPERALSLAFIWLSDRLFPSADINKRIELLLQRVAEKMDCKK